MSACRTSPLLQRGALGVLATLAAVATALFLAALLLNIGVFLMKRPLLVAALAVAAICLPGCATGAAGGVLTFEAGLRAAGLSAAAYCSLAPEGRAEIRARLNLPHLFRCPGDPTVTPADWSPPPWAGPPERPIRT